MIGDIIFIGGIHGVGKGTICEEISRRHPLIHLSSSEVLKWEELSRKESKIVKDIDSTQNLLIEGLKNIINPNHQYILDGHFCLLNENSEPEKIPENTFFKIKPKAIVVLTCEIDIIIDRLSTRDNFKYDYSVLDQMQKLEIKQAKKVAQQLNIPYLKIENENYESLNDLIKKI